MALHDEHDDDMDSPAWGDAWAVTRCQHGCVHIHLDRTSISLTPLEFERLTRMLTAARQRFTTDGPVPRADRSH